MTLAHLQILGTAGDTTPSVLYFSDSVRLLFNCGEGERDEAEHATQRALLLPCYRARGPDPPNISPPCP